jgi:hypothetical protein
VLVIPSVIVAEEFCILINASHPASVGITAAKVRRWLHDPRLVRPLP